MPSKPSHTPEGDRKAAERQFVGREEFIAPVELALKEPQRAKPLVLVYYGAAGIGKSRLRRERARQLAADPSVLLATLDFDVPDFRQPETALLALRTAIAQTYYARFPSFDLAYAVYWQKTHPDVTLGDDLKPLLESGSLLSRLVDDAGRLPLIGLVPKIASKLRDQGIEGSRDQVENPPTSSLPPSTFYLNWWERRGERELKDLPQLEPGAIVARLPGFWAGDLRDCLLSGRGKSLIVGRPTPSRAVLFVDTYEGMWETGCTEADFFRRDEWVRDLIKLLPELLWVICGRQKLRWEEVEKDWGNALSQHELGALPDTSARRFLESCDVTNGQIQDAIVKGSQGVPHYLHLAVDTIQSSKLGVRVCEFQDGSPHELVGQFTRHFDSPVVETLRLLSAPRFWYYGLFEHLTTEYQTGYPLGDYDQLLRFSFVSEGAAPGTQTMHQLMREALQEEQPPELRRSVHQFLHEYYARQLEGLNVKGITDLQRMAMAEAFYHARQVKAPDELWAWVKDLIAIFDAAGQYRFVIPIYREVVRAHEPGR